MAKTSINALDAAAEAVTLNDLMQWIECARNYCAVVVELAREREEIRKAIKNHLGYVFPREWQPEHEGSGLGFLLMHQRGLLTSITKPSTPDVSKGAAA